MKTITLTQSQREQIAQELYDNITDGGFTREIILDDNLTVDVEGYLDIDGYSETGGYVETSRYAWVELTAWVGEDYEECMVDADSELYVEKYLCNAA